MRARCIAVDATGLLLANENTVGGEHRIEVQRPKEGVVANVEPNEGSELDDLFLGVVLAQPVVERLVDRLGFELHQLGVFERDLLGVSERVTRPPVIDAVIDTAFG